MQVPVNVDYRGPFLEHLVNTASASVLIVEDALLDAVDRVARDAAEHLRAVVVVGGAGRRRARCAVETVAFCVAAGPASGARRRPPSPPRTSARSTSPRARRAARRARCSRTPTLHLLAERNRELLDLGAGDAYMTELPLFHINAQMSVYSSLLVGAQRPHRAALLGQRAGSTGCGRAGRRTRRCSA